MKAESHDEARATFVQLVRRVAAAGWTDGSTARASLSFPGHRDVMEVVEPEGAWDDLQPYELWWPAWYDDLFDLHGSRPDANCVVEVHPPSAMTLALMCPGFEPRLSRDGLRFLDHRHAVVGAELSVQHSAWLAPTVEALTRGARAVFLAGRSIVVVAESPSGVWDDLRRLERACELQLRLASAGGAITAVTRGVAATVAGALDGAHHAA
jgi:Class II Aldolase and Adducin N-terminal domain